MFNFTFAGWSLCLAHMQLSLCPALPVEVVFLSVVLVRFHFGELILKYQSLVDFSDLLQQLDRHLLSLVELCLQLLFCG